MRTNLECSSRVLYELMRFVTTAQLPSERGEGQQRLAAIIAGVVWVNRLAYRRIRELEQL
jgi:hypothetical protein